MKKFLYIVCCVVLVVSLAGCKSSASVLPPTEIETTTAITETITVKDTMLTTKPDNSYYQAYIDCLNGKAVLKPIKSKPGNYLKAPDVKIKDNKLEVNCKAEAQKLFFSWKEKFIKEHSKTKTTVSVAVKLPLTGWETFQVYCGRLFLFLVLAFIIGVILRMKKII